MYLSGLLGWAHAVAALGGAEGFQGRPWEYPHCWKDGWLVGHLSISSVFRASG